MRAFWVNIALWITFGLIQLPEKVTLTEMFDLLAMGNETAWYFSGPLLREK
jgi:hypothetical protein